MKKILMILMMVLLCSTTVMGQTKKRNTAKKRKAKTERAMTEFEKWQKEQYLDYLYGLFEVYYNKAKVAYQRGTFKETTINAYYREANRFKMKYEEAESKSYYVDLTKFSQEYYNGRCIFTIYIHDDGLVELASVRDESSGFQKDCGKTEKELGLEIVKRICEQKGYYGADSESDYYAERNSELDDFAKLHKRKESKNGAIVESSDSDCEAIQYVLSGLEMTEPTIYKDDAVVITRNKWGVGEDKTTVIPLVKNKQDEKCEGSRTSALSGLIVDETEQPMIGAVITATHTPSGTVYNATSNTEGRYNIQGMRPGDYTLTVSYVGYGEPEINGIKLEVGNRYNLNVPMTLNNMSFDVDVTEIANQINILAY